MVYQKTELHPFDNYSQKIKNKVSMSIIQSITKSRFPELFCHSTWSESYSRKILLKLTTNVHVYTIDFGPYVIQLDRPDLTLFENIIKKILSQLPIENYLSDESLVSSQSKVEIFKELLMDLGFGEIYFEDQIPTIFNDFMYLELFKEADRDKMYSHFFRRLHQLNKKIQNTKVGKILYSHYHLKEELLFYKNFYSVVDSFTDRAESEYDKWVLRDIPDDEKNEIYFSDLVLPEIELKWKMKLKLKSKIHQDLLIHLELIEHYFKDKSLNEILELHLKWIQKMISKGYSYKLNLFRQILKSSTEETVQDMKEKGYLALYSIETTFGYRVDKSQRSEIVSQFKKSFYAGNEKNGIAQKTFFLKHFQSFLDFKGNHSKTMREYQNVRVKNKEFLDPYAILYADGSSSHHMSTNKGKKVMSKTQFFSLCPNTKKIFEETTKVDDNIYNSIILKRETVKQRIVFNTTLNTYVPLEKISNDLIKTWSGLPVCFPLMNKTQKSDFFGRISKYLAYNRSIEQRYLILPLDYSSFDTTSTMDLIQTTIEEFGRNSPFEKEINNCLQKFLELLKNEKIEFENKDVNIHQYFTYKYGMLSGWKITNLVESMLNAVVTFGVFSELKSTICDIATMGDDLIIIIDKKGMNEKSQKKFLEKVSEKYNKLGFNIHPIKNMIGYRFGEFLRIAYYPYNCVSYPIRNIISLYFIQPLSSKDYLNYTNYSSSISRYVFRNNLGNKKEYEMKYFLTKNINPNIRENGFEFFKKPKKFELSMKKEFEYRTKLTETEINTSSVVQKYQSMFPSTFHSQINKYVKNNIFSKIVNIETIRRKKDDKNYARDNRKMLYLEEIVLKTINSPNLHNFKSEYSLETPDYHLSALMMIYLDEIKKQDLLMKKMALLEVAYNYSNLTNWNYSVFRHTLGSINSNSSLIFLMKSFKLKTYFCDYNNLIVSQIKKHLYSKIINDCVPKKILNNFNKKYQNLIFTQLLSRLLQEKSMIYTYCLNRFLLINLLVD